MKLNAEMDIILNDGHETLNQVRSTIINNVCGTKHIEYHTFPALLGAGLFDKRAIRIECKDESEQNMTNRGKQLPIITSVSELKWKGTLFFHSFIFILS